jgi:hypothetical protein
MMILFILILLLCVIAFILFYFYKNNKFNKTEELLIKGCYKKTSYLTKTELNFYLEMKKAIADEYTIGFQTRIIDLFNMPKNLRKNNYSQYMKIFNKFNKKTVDFIILDKNLNILCAIELDDASHNQQARLNRDYEVNQLFAYIKIPLVRYKVGSKYNFEVLNNILLKLNEIEQALSIEKIKKV